MFLLVCVILFTGESASVHAGIPPPREQTPPWEQTPLGADTPSEQTPGGSASVHAGIPPHPPAGADPSPIREQMAPLPPAYGQWVACTHPTWMHSCCLFQSTHNPHLGVGAESVEESLHTMQKANPQVNVKFWSDIMEINGNKCFLLNNTYFC